MPIGWKSPSGNSSLGSGANLTRTLKLKPLDFIQTARDLAKGSGVGRPREVNLRRAISTAYYGLFHFMTENCANTLVGGPNSGRSLSAWTQTHRALQHRSARKRCADGRIRKFPPELQELADRFVDMQQKRHNADYNPDETFFKSGVVRDIRAAEEAIQRASRVKDRRAFAVWVLFEPRKN